MEKKTQPEIKNYKIVSPPLCNIPKNIKESDRLPPSTKDKKPPPGITQEFYDKYMR